MRAYWRASVLSSLFTHAIVLKLVPFGTLDLAALPERIREPMIQRCRELLDWACEREREGARRDSVERGVDADVLRALRQLLEPVSLPW